LRRIQEEMDPQRKVSAQWQEPPDNLPTAHADGKEPELPKNDQEASATKSHSAKKNEKRSRTDLKDPTKSGADASVTQKKIVAHNE
jgi:hypothetical protein